MELPLALYAAYDFLPSGRYLVTSEGELRDTRDGAVVWQLPMDAADLSRIAGPGRSSGDGGT